MLLSVIIPVYNEEKYIATCIDSILQQKFPKENLEVIFVDGMSSDKTRLIISDYIEQYPFICIVDNPQKIVPVAMNIGIRASKGEVIIRLDAHACYTENYFSVLCDYLNILDAENVGAACVTDVLNRTPKSLAIKEVLSNKFGVGNSVFRTGVNKIMQVDTVPFGCWKRSVFDKYGYYDERLVRNQDIEFNKRIIRNGGKIFLVPYTSCTYLARETFVDLAKNNYSNGFWNILTVFYTKQINSLSIRHFIPLLFLLSLLVPSLLSLFAPTFILITLLSAILYFLFTSVISLHLSIKKRLNYIYLVIAFAVLHFSYGIGSFVGLCKLPFLRLKN
jgi:glycosyltransferase involved in cell wall biosynthesis